MDSLRLTAFRTDGADGLALPPGCSRDVPAIIGRQNVILSDLMQHFALVMHRGGCMEATPLSSIARDSPETEMAALFTDERDGLVRMATLMVGSAAIGEEVVQDAFAAIGPRWETVEQPGAYLRRSVANGCAQVLRRRDAERRAIDSLVPRPHMSLPTRLVELAEALDQLSARQRMVIVLRYFVDLHDDDIAETLDLKPSSVRSVARRAMAILRKELE